MIFEPSIFRAYDIRGTYPNQMNEQVAYAVGQAFVAVTGAKNVAVGRDVRSSGESLKASLIKGVLDAGANVIDLENTISTEMLYFAAGTLECDGGMSITASHNPAEWNGVKMCGKGAIPFTKEDMLGKIYAWVQEGHTVDQFEKGTTTSIDLLPEYTEYLNEYKPSSVPQLKIVANANFGATGKSIDRVVEGMPIELIRLNWNEDGTFPKGSPDPLLPKNRTEIADQIVSEGADFGVAWDADADRAFFYDEKGRAIPGYYINAMMISHFLAKEKGGTVLIEPRQVWATKAAAEQAGGAAYTVKVGHAYIKAAMREHNAVFGGENSGHFYFRDFFRCDNGAISFLTMLGIFAEHITKGGVVSELLDTYQEQYPATEELNFTTDIAGDIIAGFKEKYSDALIEEVDGVSIEYPDFRFNLRKSNTEPVLRLNLEAHTPEDLTIREKEVVETILATGATLRNDA